MVWLPVFLPARVDYGSAAILLLSGEAKKPGGVRAPARRAGRHNHYRRYHRDHSARRGALVHDIGGQGDDGGAVLAEVRQLGGTHHPINAHVIGAPMSCAHGGLSPSRTVVKGGL